MHVTTEEGEHKNVQAAWIRQDKTEMEESIVTYFKGLTHHLIAFCV